VKGISADRNITPLDGVEHPNPLAKFLTPSVGVVGSDNFFKSLNGVQSDYSSPTTNNMINSLKGQTPNEQQKKILFQGQGMSRR
jgi:hypothetical protein